MVAAVSAGLALGGAGQPRLSAGEPDASSSVRAADTAVTATRIAIKAGGPAILVGHTTWTKDQYAVGGHPVSTRSPIRGTTSDAFFRTARAGASGYRIPVGASGTYKVTLKFAEIQGKRPGQRVFGVTAEGRKIIGTVDIARAAGLDHPVSVSRLVTVRDGVLNLNLTAHKGQTLVSGIAVNRVLTPSTSGGAVARRSGLGWPSGVYTPGGNPSQYEDFGSWRGNRVDVATMWTARATWSDIVDPDWLYRTWAGTPETKVLGIPPFPEDGTSNLAQCAKGAYDDEWARFATNIKAAGMDDESIIRLGWEFNGNWYAWAAYDPDQFVQCWRHIVTTAESIAPALRWDWTVNRGAGASVKDARKAWPGNHYVDIVGVDSYDIWPGATTATAWSTQANGDYGLDFWLDFAKAHDKKLSVPEWGVYPGTSHRGHNGGDNAYYVKKMHDFFAANASHIAYESYFNESASYYAGSIYGPDQNPKAAAEYKKEF